MVHQINYKGFVTSTFASVASEARSGRDPNPTDTERFDETDDDSSSR